MIIKNVDRLWSPRMKNEENMKALVQHTPPPVPIPPPPGLPIDEGVCFMFLVAIIYGVLKMKTENNKRNIIK